jgi:hypothetical protein
MLFAAEVSYEICVSFLMGYPDEMSCFFGPLQALRMRFRECLAVVGFFDEITFFDGVM